MLLHLTCPAFFFKLQCGDGGRRGCIFLKGRIIQMPLLCICWLFRCAVTEFAGDGRGRIACCEEVLNHINKFNSIDVSIPSFPYYF